MRYHRCFATLFYLLLIFVTEISENEGYSVQNVGTDQLKSSSMVNVSSINSPIITNSGNKLASPENVHVNNTKLNETIITVNANLNQSKPILNSNTTGNLLNKSPVKVIHVEDVTANSKNGSQISTSRTIADNAKPTSISVTKSDNSTNMKNYNITDVLVNKNVSSTTVGTSFSNQANSETNITSTSPATPVSAPNTTPLLTTVVHNTTTNAPIPATTAPIPGTAIPIPTPNTTTSTNTSHTEKVTPGEPVLPEKGSAEQERNSSISIFFVLCVLALGILLIHLMLSTHFQYLPESIAIVFLGAIIGLILNLMSDKNIANWRKEEAFSPTAFFLVLLPPIIFESGYNLHKGNFFQNIGTILVFAIFGTLISALVIGTGIFILGLADIAYQLSFVESFAFGSLISAVDPVATVAIFHALDIDPVLNMLVFGESILNDAVAIVLTTSILKSDGPEMSTSEAVLTGINQFCLMFFASAGIGVIFALTSALLLKYVDLRKHPSLEFGMMLVFTYAPYALAEGIHLSGIMAILFNGIVMSHYTHFNLSTVTQITMQQTMRTLAFIAETCVFAYLGLALFSFRHRFEPALVSWSLILCLLGRACNIYPLAILCNKFREHKITNRMMFIMWFSGLRGAISYALSLHLEFSDETRHVIITTTLIIVLVTTLVFGGSTMPLMKILQGSRSNNGRKTGRKRRKDKTICLSKTKEWGQAIDSEHLSELTEEELEGNFNPSHIRGFAKLDIRYLIPFFTRRFTQQELKDCKTQMTDLTNQWYQAIRISPLESEEEKSKSPCS